MSPHFAFCVDTIAVCCICVRFETLLLFLFKEVGYVPAPVVKEKE